MGIRVTVTVHDHEDPELWCALGPLVADRIVHRDLGGPVFSTGGTVWFLAERPSGELVGFASLRPAGDTLWYDYGWVASDRRGKGVFTRLAKERDRVVADLLGRVGDYARLRTVVREERWHHYEERGWSVHSRRGSWVHGVKELRAAKGRRK